MSKGGAQAGRARELYRENQDLLRSASEITANCALLPISMPATNPVISMHLFPVALWQLVYLFDSLGLPEVSPEEVALLSFGETDGGVWTAFHRADEYKRGIANSSEDHRLIDMTHHEIDASIKGTASLQPIGSPFELW